MKLINSAPFKLCVLAGAVAVAQSSLAATDLYISEYIEGSSCNKALEIYNGTGVAVNLSGYQIKMYANGSSSAGVTINLTGSVAAGDVYVVANSGSSCTTSSAILTQADLVNTSGWYNGNDAVALAKNGTNIDIIGQIGVNPGAAWGTGSNTTLDHTLRRKSSVSDGDSVGNNAFDPATEWDAFPVDTFGDLGQYAGSSSGGGSGGSGQTSQCGQPATAIHSIQGSGAASPLVGQVQSIEGVVTGSFQGSTKLTGFFVQEKDSTIDNDASTSEGILVYDSGSSVAVNVGDVVHVKGTVTEYYGMTELNNVTQVDVCTTGASVAATPISLPLASSTDLERVEGMLVTNAQALTVSENYDLARYGELTLSNGRLFVPTNLVAPGSAAVAAETANLLNHVLIDDGSSTQNPALIPYPAPQLTAANTLRSGDTVLSVKGVLNYAFNEYVIEPTETPSIMASNPRPAVPAMTSGRIRVASFNVLNYFNGNGSGGGFPTSRGATTAAEFAKQEAKIVAAMSEMHADVLGLMELENDGFGAQSAIRSLVNALNAATGENYAFINPGLTQVGSDEITVGIIYNSAKVRPVGSTATTAAYPFDNKNRQPIAQSFEEIASLERFTVAVNHFKSKGSCPGDASSNDDQADGQSCWNPMRVAAANALTAWLATNPTGISDPDKIIMGDLNAYAKEDPITAIKSAGYKNLIDLYLGNAAYSFVFNGEAGYLDHALASLSLAKQTVNVAEWHINADEPHALDYNEEYKSAAQITSLYAADAYRSSDHDPVMLELLLAKPGDFNADGVRNSADLTLLLRENYKPLTVQNWKFDLNDDGLINASDVSYFQKNYNGK